MASQQTRQDACRIGKWLLGAFLLAHTSSAAEPIRILVVMPGESGTLARQVRVFDSALLGSRGPVARASSLAQADAVVEFTAYRRLMRDGKSQDWWYGRYVLLQAALEDASSADAKRFAFVVIDREDWQVEPVLNMLGRTLGGALGLAPASLPGKSPEHGAGEQGVEADEAR